MSVVLRGRVIESVVLQTALGIRFWDAALNRPVIDGLQVLAQRLNAAADARVGRPVLAKPTLSGVYAFAGLHPDERSDRRPLPAYRVVVEVTDLYRRFLPATFIVAIPSLGVFKGVGAWLSHPLMRPIPDAGSEQGVFLWSAPSRAIPAGWTAVYAMLVVSESAEPSPAAWAVAHISTQNGTTLGYGMADEGGRLMIPIPYPSLPQPVNDDPPPPLRAVVFNLQAEVFYDPAKQKSILGSRVPDLSLLLEQTRQPVAVEHNPADNTFSYANSLSFSLRFEEPAVLRTALTGRPRGEAILRIQE